MKPITAEEARLGNRLITALAPRHSHLARDLAYQRVVMEISREAGIDVARRVVRHVEQHRALTAPL